MRLIPLSLITAAGLLATASGVLLPSSAATAHPTAAVRYSTGDQKTETRPVTADFTGIDLNTADNVVVQQGKTAAISITGPIEELARTETAIEKGRLVIRKSGKDRLSWSKDANVVVTVTMPVIESLNINGSGNLTSTGTLTGSNMAISIAGSGDARVTLEMTGTVSTGVAGSGDVRLSGRCATHTVRLAGSGDIRADALRANTATVKLSGSGDISVAVAESLDVSISGSGDVRYAGEPKQLVKRVTGSGSVAKL